MSNNITSNFLNAIQKHANMQKAEIEKELKKYREQQISEGKERALKDAYNLIQNELATKRSTIISEYSEKAADSKRDLYKKRLEMVDHIRTDVIKKLDEFTKTDRYDEYLKRSLEQISNYIGDSSCVLYIRECDKDRINRAADAVIAISEISADDSIKIGGIKAYIEDQGIIIDDSLDSTLDQKMDIFISECSLKVN